MAYGKMPGGGSVKGECREVTKAKAGIPTTPMSPIGSDNKFAGKAAKENLGGKK